MPEWEICTIEPVTVVQGKDTFFSKSPRILRWEFRKVTSSGIQVLSASENFEDPNFYDQKGDDRKAKELRQRSDLAREKLISKLSAEGWRPVTGRLGAVITMKRQIGTQISGEEDLVSPSVLLRQITNLRNKGILTEEEYQANKAEIMKRR